MSYKLSPVSFRSVGGCSPSLRRTIYLFSRHRNEFSVHRFAVEHRRAAFVCPTKMARGNILQVVSFSYTYFCRWSFGADFVLASVLLFFTKRMKSESKAFRPFSVWCSVLTHRSNQKSEKWNNNKSQHWRNKKCARVTEHFFFFNQSLAVRWKTNTWLHFSAWQGHLWSPYGYKPNSCWHIISETRLCHFWLMKNTGNFWRQIASRITEIITLENDCTVHTSYYVYGISWCFIVGRVCAVKL